MSTADEIKALEEEIALLKRALGFYADRENWRSPVEDDLGEIAKIALGVESDSEDDSK